MNLPASGLFLALVLTLLGWAYWPSLAALEEQWRTMPQYGHGYLVPLVALALLWKNRDHLTPAFPRPDWFGIACVAAGGATRLLAAQWSSLWLDGVSLILTLLGVGGLFFGRAALLWFGPAVGFLAFMLPLPFRLEVALGTELRRVVTTLSTWSLQTLGLPAVSEGNLILVNDLELGVAEACSGLSMLMTFAALALAAAMLTKTSPFEKVVLVGSAVPIAILANVTRVVATGALHETYGGRVSDAFVHDSAGWLMMPLAVGLLGLEKLFLNRLWVADD